MYSNIFKEILNSYSKKKDKAESEAKKFKTDLYNEVPRLKEIDNELFNNGLNISKLLIDETQNKESLLSSLQQKNQKLKDEKLDLLNKIGYTENDLKPKYECNKCNDTGYIGTKKCSCLEQLLIKKAYSSSNLETILYEQNFDNFDFIYYSDKIIPEKNISPLENIKINYQISHNFVMDFDKNFENLLFYGSPGTGKTFLCSCIAKDLLDKKKTVIYITAFDLFKLIEDIKFNKTNDKTINYSYINYIFNVDLLIIDDLGTEFNTSLSNAELFNCINTRIINKKSTVISTNLSPENLRNMYSARISSRIVGNYIQLNFFGRDIRQLKKHIKK